MSLPLRQSTASQEVPIGPFLDDTDGKTAETGLTITNGDVKLWKHGATAEVAKDGTAGTTNGAHMAQGRHYVVVDAADTGTLGGLRVAVHVTGALPCQTDCIVLSANVYDSLIAASDKLDVNAAELGGTAQTAGDVGADALAVHTAVDNATSGLPAIKTAVAALGLSQQTTINTQETSITQRK